MTALRARLGLNSLRGRYFFVAAILSIALLLVAFWGERVVNRILADSRSNTQERSDIDRDLTAIGHLLWSTQHRFEQYMLDPDTAHRQDTLRELAEASGNVETLLQHKPLRANDEAVTQLEVFQKKLHQLTRRIDEVMRLRGSPRELYPALPIMQDLMFLAHQRFFSYAGLGVEEAVMLEHQVIQREAHRLFTDARTQWLGVISGFRGYVAARSGVFDEPARAMQVELGNVATNASALRDTLARLDGLERKNALELQQSDALANMKSAFNEWWRGYEQVLKVYASEEWRRDIPIVKSSIHPLFDELHRDLRAVEHHIQATILRDFGAVTATANALSGYVTTLAFGALITIWIAFALFERAVRRPLAQVASALKAEAQGAEPTPLPRTQTTETADLVAAFAYMRHEVHSRQQRLENILDNAAEGIITFDERGTIQTFNKAAELLFGYDERDAQGKDLSLIMPPDRRDSRPGYLEHFLRTEIARLIGHEGEVVGRHRDGTRFPMALKISKLTLDDREIYTGLVSDISERKAMVEHLKQMAEHDGLTGLYNRAYFSAELERVVERARRPGGQPCSVLYIDLDNFKYVNDTLGHAAGDKLLIEVASMLNKRVRKSDLISRFGGDEFTVLLYNANAATAHRVADAFRQRMVDYAFKSGGERIDVGCSIGVSEVDTTIESAAEVLSRADMACHLAKREGRNRVHVFETADQQNVSNMSLDIGWARRIREAINNNRFALACQPIVSTKTLQPNTYEVLIRMLDDNGDLIMPSGFLPAAERFGLSVDIDRWVISNAIETLAQQRTQRPDLRYSLNLSARTLADKSVLELIVQKLKETRLAPSALTFEVTETVAISDMTVAQDFLKHLQEVGCETALDDFGSGFSSFAYLKDLPVDTVKIDGRFVKNLAKSPVDQAMVRAMNDIAHALGKNTVAEFVEDKESLDLLVAFGVDFAQGYHLGRPDTAMPCQAIAHHAGQESVCAIVAGKG